MKNISCNFFKLYFYNRKHYKNVKANKYLFVEHYQSVNNEVCPSKFKNLEKKLNIFL